MVEKPSTITRNINKDLNLIPIRFQPKEIQTCKLKITSTTVTSVTVSPTRKRWYTRHPVLISVTVHDQHLKKAYRETPAETA